MVKSQLIRHHYPQSHPPFTSAPHYHNQPHYHRRSAGSGRSCYHPLQTHIPLASTHQTRVLHASQHPPPYRSPGSPCAPHCTGYRVPHYCQLPEIESPALGGQPHVWGNTAPSYYHGYHPCKGRIPLQTGHRLPCQTQDASVYQTQGHRRDWIAVQGVWLAFILSTIRGLISSVGFYNNLLAIPPA